MSTPLQDALHEFVQASNHYTAALRLDVPEREQGNADKRLARAGDAFESALADFVAKHAGRGILQFLGGEG